MYKIGLAADFTPFGKCSAHRAQCYASSVPWTAHRVLWTAFCASRSTSCGKCQMARAARIAPDTSRPARDALRFLHCGQWRMSSAARHLGTASRRRDDVRCRVQRALRPLRDAPCAPAFCPRDPASRLLLDVVAHGVSDAETSVLHSTIFARGPPACRTKISW